MNTNKDIFIYIIIATLIFLLVYVVASTNLLEPQIKKDDPIQQVQMTIIAPGWAVNYTSTNNINITVADLLFEWAIQSNCSIEKEFFSGYDSFVITGINGTLNGQNDSYWQFYVNGEYATYGCNSYFLQNNDWVEWRFEPLPW